MAAEHVDHRRPAALERHHHGVDPRHHGEQHRGGVREAADAGVREVQRARFALASAISSFTVVAGTDGCTVNALGPLPSEATNVSDLPMSNGSLVMCGVTAWASDTSTRVSHRLARRRPSPFQDTAGARAVFRRHLLAEPFAELGRGEPRHDVDAAARRERNDQTQRLRRIVLRRGWAASASRRAKALSRVARMPVGVLAAGPSPIAIMGYRGMRRRDGPAPAR